MDLKLIVVVGKLSNLLMIGTAGGTGYKQVLFGANGDGFTTVVLELLHLTITLVVHGGNGRNNNWSTG